MFAKLLVFGFCLEMAEGYDQELVKMLRTRLEEHGKPNLDHISRDKIAEETADFDQKLMPSMIETSQEFMEQQDDKKCKTCVMEVAKYVMKYEFDKLEAWCNDDSPSKCPVKKRICRMLEKVPDVLAGLIFDWATPLRDGTFWCLGHGECKAEELMKEDKGSIMPFDVIKSLNKVNLDDFEGLNIADGEERFDWEDEEDFAMELGSIQGEQIDMPGHPKPCKKCMRKVIRAIMKHTVEKVCEWCQNHKDDKKIAWICNWAENHKKFVFGVLLGVVEPWKYAYGYCLPHENHDNKLKFKKMLFDAHKRYHYYNEYIPANAKDLTGMQTQGRKLLMVA